jgi:hypothetical protein
MNENSNKPQTTVADYVVTRAKKALTEQKEFLLHGKINAYIKNAFTTDIDLGSVFKRVEGIIPLDFLSEVDIIYIGDFEELKERRVNALYDNGAIYISNEQSSEEDLLDDLVHEMAHALEDAHGEIIYSDGLVRREFLAKREKLYFLLKAEGYKFDDRLFMNPEFTNELDDIILNEVGYEKITSLTIGLFIDPYSITSLREYFASAFEFFFLRADKKYVQSICPVTYEKIIELINYIEV